MTLAQIQRNVRRRLNEAGSEFFTDADIAESVREGLDEIADASEYYERVANIPMLDSRGVYDLSTILPDTFLSPRRVFESMAQQWLLADSPRGLDEHTYAQWELTEGPPERYFLRGNWWLGVWPKPASDHGFLRLYYTAIPAPLLDSEEPAFPPEFQIAAEEYALGDLMAQQKETAKALNHFKAASGYTERLTTHVQKRQSLQRRDVFTP